MKISRRVYWPFLFTVTYFLTSTLSFPVIFQKKCCFSQIYSCAKEIWTVIHQVNTFLADISICTLLKQHKTFGFLLFSGGTEWKHWPGMGPYYVNILNAPGRLLLTFYHFDLIFYISLRFSRTLCFVTYNSVHSGLQQRTTTFVNKI